MSPSIAPGLVMRGTSSAGISSPARMNRPAMYRVSAALATREP
nr:MAG TPA: hypothetical protein [Caudoviricetes sp.]